MSKLILHYDDHFSYEMLLRCFDEYMESENFKRQGVQSITVYRNEAKHIKSIGGEMKSIRCRLFGHKWSLYRGYKGEPHHTAHCEKCGVKYSAK